MFFLGTFPLRAAIKRIIWFSVGVARNSVTHRLGIESTTRPRRRPKKLWLTEAIERESVNVGEGLKVIVVFWRKVGSDGELGNLAHFLQ